jgi:hypothetical protein
MLLLDTIIYNVTNFYRWPLVEMLGSGPTAAFAQQFMR